MGRNKKVKKTQHESESDAGSETQEVPAEVEEVVAPEESAVEESGGKKEKKLSKKALQRMEQQKRSADAPPSKKKKKRGDTSSDEESDKEDEPTSSAAAAAPVAAAAPQPASDSDSDDDLPPTYPIKVTYCPNCTFPIEMCEYSGMFEKCKPFLIQLLGEDAVAKISDKGRKRKIATDAEKLEAMLARDGKNKLEKHVVMEIKSRGNGRFITYVRGLELFGINMKDLAKDFKKAFATGAGITSEPGKLDAIEVQGEFVDQIAEILMKRFSVSKDAIYKQDGKNTYPLFGEKPQKETVEKKPKKAQGKQGMEQQAPDFESGERIVKSKIVVAEKKEKVVAPEPERVRLFGPKVRADAPKTSCFNCGQEGHLSRDCPTPKATRGGCFNCGQDGHLSRDCPNPKTAGRGRGGDAAVRGRGEGRGRGQ